MKIDELHLIANEIIPPLPGGLKYAGKVRALFVTENGEKRRIAHEFGETWGCTESEAKAKMETIVKKWVESQP